jgi:hypothetical protein
MEVLQTSALPLGYATAGIFILANFANFTNFVLGYWAGNIDLAVRLRRTYGCTKVLGAPIDQGFWVSLSPAMLQGESGI